MHELTEKVKLLQKCVVFCQGKLLLVKRSETAKTRPNCWDLPGGNAEWPKTATNLSNHHLLEVIREVQEETGLRLKAADLESCYVGTFFDTKNQVLSIILGWSTKIATLPEVKLSPEHTEFAWISENQFKQYDFGFAGEKNGFIRQMIEQSFEKLDSRGHGYVGCGH